MRRWRVVLFATGTAVLSYVLGLLILGWSSIIDFLEIVFKLTGGGQIRGAYDGSLRAFIARLVDLLAFTGLKLDGLITPLWWVSGLALLALTLWRCRKLNYDQAFSLCLVFGLMLAPTSWMHYHMALLLPMIVLLAYRQWWPVIYTALLWLSMNIFVPLDFESNPLLYGMLLSLSLFALYFALCQPKLFSKTDLGRS